MNPLALLRFYVPGLAFPRAARRRLSAAQAQRAEAIWQTAAEQQALLATRRPRHSAGVNLVIRYLEWDLALYRALHQHGASETEAGMLIEEINWELFGPPTRFGFALTRLRSAQRATRVGWLLDLMFALIFSWPFRREVRPRSQGLAFDVTRCPLAEYLRDNGAPELTRHAACSLDYRMAQDWGVSLQRTQTIASDAPLCDFRFKAAAKT